VLVTTLNFYVQKNTADKNLMIALHSYDMFRPIFGHHPAVVQFTQTIIFFRCNILLLGMAIQIGRNMSSRYTDVMKLAI